MRLISRHASLDAAGQGRVSLQICRGGTCARTLKGSSGKVCVRNLSRGHVDQIPA